ncbi:ADP-ribose pyrophosphatase YjhB (NUDIX family) [Serratia fonticola]|uniref:ADP-ribose pyrophosphatase YjhB (NUDIX family) n=1 Tax=Serratia fonticola TaxID=47917 RepID=A0A542D0S8_SERFO|nr:NUDIX domain-containing protein [Serratia fonticola]TQI81298.1 ADP-ribose pyrophosphatase YjhB (NUDIX family) [Serratia fonticola]TQI96678.1 ADP-ribose pyrophosphatase YjhB (NUDIX family) [Serratia fonticola]TVZ71175.1 ADP-ribose pyrophosphatase YjhB (NUDIX family) [Serratia fonticola]
MTVATGVGVIIVNPQGQILLGKRCGTHAPFWSIPGGHLDAGETFEQCAQREIAEETGLQIGTPTFIGISNNLQTWLTEGKHTVSICMMVQHPGGEAVLKEPEKCAQWRWCSPDDLPEPHFEASRMAIHLWQNQQVYQPTC